MLKLSATDQAYRVPVTVHVPIPDGGYQEQVYQAYFRYPGRKALDDLVRTASHTATAENADQRILSTWLAGWRDIQAADGSDLDYSPETLATLSDITYWRTATAAAFIRWALALPEKNSEPPPAH